MAGIGMMLMPMFDMTYCVHVARSRWFSLSISIAYLQEEYITVHLLPSSLT